MKASLLDPHVGTIIWTIITFLLVLFVLKKWAWPPILSALDEREERIRSAIDGSEKARQEAEAVLSEHRKKLGTILSSRPVKRHSGRAVRPGLISKPKNVLQLPNYVARWPTWPFMPQEG